MFISKIELTNFKSYQHAELEFPEPIDGKNIVIIGGLNGYGKTTMLEALYLCLYGKDALPHLSRAGLKIEDSRGYPTFLEKALNGEAKREQADVMTVRVVINRTKTIGIDILRRWFFRSNGTWDAEETIVREVHRGISDAPKKDGERNFLLTEILEQQYVPAHIAPFFFFDGEEVKKLADQSRIEQVKQGLEGLLGVVLLRNLAKRMTDFENMKRSKLSNVDEENIEILEQTLTNEENKLKSLLTNINENLSNLSNLKAERQSLMDRFLASGGGSGAIATVKDLVEEKTQYKNELKEIKNNLSKILADKLPFYLMPASLLKAFKLQINSEIALAKWQIECQAIQPKRDKFFNELLINEFPSFSPPLNESQLKTLEVKVESAWTSLFLPPPPNCADENIHDYLHDELKQKAIKFLNTINIGKKEIHELTQNKNQIELRIDEISRRISRVEGIDRDGTVAQLKNDLTDLENKIGELENQTGALERDRTSLEAVIHQVKARFENEKSRRDATSPDRKLIELSLRTRKVIDELIPALFPLKVKKLSLSMTKVYKQLAHKTQVSKIVIENDGTTNILSATNKPMVFDRSAGENQIFATALIAGLAEVSKIQAPLVVDTPLGRLDSKHRDNIFDFWTSDPERQVILLSQDEEITPERFKKIKSNISKTYLLDHTDVGDGIGRTRAIPDKYFGANSK